MTKKDLKLGLWILTFLSFPQPSFVNFFRKCKIKTTRHRSISCNILNLRNLQIDFALGGQETKFMPKKEAGFIKQIIIFVILGLLAVFGYFTYQSFRNNMGGFSWNNIGGFFNKTVNDTKAGVENAKNQAIQDAKQSTANALKNKVDETLGTESK